MPEMALQFAAKNFLPQADAFHLALHQQGVLDMRPIKVDQ